MCVSIYNYNYSDKGQTTHEPLLTMVLLSYRGKIFVYFAWKVALQRVPFELRANKKLIVSLLVMRVSSSKVLFCLP